MSDREVGDERPRRAAGAVALDRDLVTVSLVNDY
jgi:hypothetical protein